MIAALEQADVGDRRCLCLSLSACGVRAIGKSRREGATQTRHKQRYVCACVRVCVGGGGQPQYAPKHRAVRPPSPTSTLGYSRTAPCTGRLVGVRRCGSAHTICTPLLLSLHPRHPALHLPAPEYRPVSAVDPVAVDPIRACSTPPALHPGPNTAPAPPAPREPAFTLHTNSQAANPYRLRTPCRGLGIPIAGIHRRPCRVHTPPAHHPHSPTLSARARANRRGRPHSRSRRHRARSMC